MTDQETRDTLRHALTDWDNATDEQRRAAGAADFTVENHGSLYLIQPLTGDAVRRITEKVEEGAQYWCGALVVEPRYLEDVISGLQADGLVRR